VNRAGHNSIRSTCQLTWCRQHFVPSQIMPLDGLREVPTGWTLPVRVLQNA